MTHEQQIAQKVARIMEDGISGLDAATTDKLADARRQAVAIAGAPMHAAQAETIHAVGTRLLSGHHVHGHRSWIAALVLLTLGLLALFAWQQPSTSRVPVETDTLLLASELPPEAYVDKGFHAWLEDSSQL